MITKQLLIFSIIGVIFSSIIGTAIIGILYLKFCNLVAQFIKRKLPSKRFTNIRNQRRNGGDNGKY